jgi:hypothetical protein
VLTFLVLVRSVNLPSQVNPHVLRTVLVKHYTNFWPVLKINLNRNLTKFNLVDLNVLISFKYFFEIILF